MTWRQVNESRAEKVRRVALHLLINPQEAARWVADRFASQSPMNRALPWFSWKAIRHLDAWLEPHHNVFEIGGGGSTLFFAGRAAHIWTQEEDPFWAEKIRSAGLRNVTVLTEPGDPFPSFAPDLIVIDGPDDFAAPVNRIAALTWALTRIAPHGLIVLDDSWRYRHALPPNAELKIGVGPCRLGVTETAIIPRLV